MQVNTYKLFSYLAYKKAENNAKQTIKLIKMVEK